MDISKGRVNVIEVIKFLFCGGIAAVANIFTRFVLSEYVAYRSAIVIAYCVGMTIGFLLFKFFVFHENELQKTTKEALWFIFINLLALIQTYAISVGLSEWVFPWLAMVVYPQDVAHIIGVMVPVITSYFGHKYLTFSRGNS